MSSFRYFPYLIAIQFMILGYGDSSGELHIPSMLGLPFDFEYFCIHSQAT
jgi:hypothetical protein